jgi:hypothetical protein
MNSPKSIFLLFIFLCLNASAQSLYFCEGVTDDGIPVNDSNVFDIPYDGGYLYFLVTLSYEVACDNVFFTIYKIDRYGNDKLFDKFKINTNKNRTWFWSKYTFNKTGYYRVYFSDCFGYDLANEGIKYQI